MFSEVREHTLSNLKFLGALFMPQHMVSLGVCSMCIGKEFEFCHFGAYFSIRQVKFVDCPVQIFLSACTVSCWARYIKDFHYDCKFVSPFCFVSVVFYMLLDYIVL